MGTDVVMSDAWKRFLEKVVRTLRRLDLTIDFSVALTINYNWFLIAET